jgi:hypothetical protein
LTTHLRTGVVRPHVVSRKRAFDHPRKRAEPTSRWHSRADRLGGFGPGSAVIVVPAARAALTAHGATLCRVPLSIVVLQALDSGPRADTILAALQVRLVAAERQTFSAHDAARLPCNLLPDEARAAIEHRLDAIDADWRDCIMIRETRPRPPRRFTRSQPSEHRFTGR